MSEVPDSPARRTFLTTGAAALATAASAKKVLGANDRIRVAVIGLRGRGWSHIRAYHSIPGVELTTLCDVDENVLRKRLADTEKLGGPKPKTYIDVRKLLDDKSIDAVSIATPTHWHSLMGIWAAQRGKDVYIEKPCSHTMWEGQQLVKAVHKYKIICQHGTQCRSSPAIRQAMDKMRSGLLADMYMSRGLCYKWRNTIGHMPPSPVPAGVHYDLWTGPAPWHHFTRNRFHYNWHWFWDYGEGDLANQGVHQVDLARWGLGVALPTKVTALGGHYLFHDDQQTPNALTSAWEFKMPDGSTRMMNFEVRGWITNHEAGIGTHDFMGGGVPPAGVHQTAKVDPKPKKHHLGPMGGMPSTIGNLFYGRKGYLAISGYDSYRSFLGPHDEPGPQDKGGPGIAHFVNFIDCVRSRRAQDLHAPIEEGNRSVILVHLANASYRLGRTINFDPETEKVINDPEAEKLLKGTYRAPFTVPEHV
ncbi:MAG TPA: Gfo/Idh/MocA family oxidoreductase [Bryobacteraceae bacterium]